MLSKVILALPLLGVVRARPLLHDRAYGQWIRGYAARDDSTCVIVTVTADETVTATNNLAAATTVASATTTAAAAAASSTASSSQIGDFGSCTVPQIEFGVGFDNRKETSYQPVDQTSYDHGSADNIDIITQFMCDQLVNSCGADSLAQQTCASAKAAADTVTAMTGGQADAFNAVFGITTDFAAIAPVSDQGVTESIAAATSAAAATTNVAAATSSASADDCASNTVTVTVGATDAASATSAAAAASTAATSNVAVAAAVSATASASAAAASSTASASQIGDFGSCTVPQIEFGVGFDNRKETSYQPVDQTSYDHGSADNIDVITQFMCDQLVNTCGADSLAQQTCASATAAADTVTAKTGGQADAFNAVFGITTDFASIAPVSDTGVTESIDATTAAATAAATAATAASTTAAAAATTDAAAAATTDAAATTTAVAAAATTSAAATASATSSSSSVGDFGSCSVPEISFAQGLNGRTETAFEPTDLTSYNHGSADNIDVITQFICGQLASACGADATAQATCQTASAAADQQTAKTGAQADAFNAAFGITTDFASVPVVSDQGVTQVSAAARAFETGRFL
ncbi:hypothetical protein DAEQUDRAFT_252376 [Daedalea quercina L-15889]|uniref:Uncharacterized protein n=1 Tax=Daedalea quercina L-15889 TaxID=1314783 RepID=A0A165QPC2_9APHY|nr:hypothetical protein DAEQUDRAFT_252376 [Daedalea quercina L-15889]